MIDIEQREWEVHSQKMNDEWHKHEQEHAKEQHAEEVEKYNDGVEKPTKACEYDHCQGLGLLNVHDEICNYCSMIESWVDTDPY